MALKVFKLRRTNYSKNTTPISKREYQLVIFGPDSVVGTKTEWRKWAKKNRVKVVFDDIRNMKGEHI